MAKLSSEDREIETSFEINLKEVTDTTWQKYEIVFNFDQDKQVFKSKEGGDPSIGQFVFSLAPENRLKLMIEQIEKFLTTDTTELVFEPADPSFELIIKRSHADGFQVYLWVDCGNTKQLNYTWDARGIRFFSTKANIESFVEALKAEAAAIV